MASKSDSEVVVGPRGEHITEYWWVSSPINRFTYEVYVGRYHSPVKIDDDPESKDYWAEWSEFLNPDGKWVVVPEGGQMMPVLTLQGQMVHVISGSTRPLQLDKEGMAEALRKLCAEIVSAVIAKEARDGNQN